MKTVHVTPLPTIEAPTTIDDLTEDLMRTYAEVHNGEIKPTIAKEKANIAGKVIKGVALKLLYADMRQRGVVQEIPFMKETKALPPGKE